MKREQIRVIDIIDADVRDIDKINLEDDLLPEYDVLEKELIDYDADKNSVEYRVIIRRNIDGKFFKFIYKRYNYVANSIKYAIAEEVIPTQKMTTIYE